MTSSTPGQWQTKASNAAIHSLPRNDVEQGREVDPHLVNDTVQAFTWLDVTVSVRVKKSKATRNILQSVSGIVKAGKHKSLVRVSTISTRQFHGVNTRS